MAESLRATTAIATITRHAMGTQGCGHVYKYDNFRTGFPIPFPFSHNADRIEVDDGQVLKR